MRNCPLLRGWIVGAVGCGLIKVSPIVTALPRHQGIPCFINEGVLGRCSMSAPKEGEG